MSKNNSIYIIAGTRLLNYKFSDSDKIEVKTFNNLNYKWLMGITRASNGDIYISGNNCIINNSTDKAIVVDDGNPAFHHIKCIDDYIIAPATAVNKLVIFDLGLKVQAIIDINPPDLEKPTARLINYNHLNCVHYYKGFYYIDLNWYTKKRFSSSGVAVLDENFNEVDRFEYGWQTHGFCFIDDKKYVLCGFNKRNPNVYHPHMGGLMVDGEIVYEIGGDWFCKNFSVDDDYIYIVGGNCAIRDERNNIDGLLIILDREFNQIDKVILKDFGECRGCLLDNYDLTDT